MVCFSLFTNMLQDNSSEITYDKFIEMVDRTRYREVTLQSGTLTIVPKSQDALFEGKNITPTSWRTRMRSRSAWRNGHCVPL